MQLQQHHTNILSKKRQVWVQEIRQKQRTELKKQIKATFQCRQNIIQQLNHPDCGIQSLCQSMVEKPEYENVICEETLVWLQQGNIVKISSRENGQAWCTLLCKVMDHHPHTIQLVVEHFYQVLHRFCTHIHSFKTLLMFFTFVLKVLKKHKLPLPQPVSTHLHTLLCQWKKNFTKEHVNLFHAIVVHDPTVLQAYLSGEFIQWVVEQLKGSIATHDHLDRKIIVLLMLLTYHEQPLYLNLSNTLISCGIVSHLEFIIFKFDSQNSEIKVLAYKLLHNIIQNLPDIDDSIITYQIPRQLAYTVKDKEQKNVVRVEAFALLYTIITNYEQQEHFFQLLGKMDLLDLVLVILDELGPVEEMVIKISTQLLHYLFVLGQQRKTSQSCLNSFIVKLKYNEGEQILRKFPQTQSLLQHYQL